MIFMIVNLHDLSIALHCEAQMVRDYWQQLFAGWTRVGEFNASVELHLSLVNSLPTPPEKVPFFVDTDALEVDVGLLSVYQQTHDEVLLYYKDGAVVCVPLADERPLLTGHVIAKALQYGRLEDITFTSLAPFLRRRGYYLVHAFGASKDGHCVLIVGASGNGKTTTGLSLVMAGWELLANDVLLIEVRGDGVYALPTPGGLSIREETLDLLPACTKLISDTPNVQGKYNLTNQHVWQKHVPKAARITAVYFCQIEERMVSQKRPLSPAFALAHLMEQSIDRWDEKMLKGHITVLEKLSQQSACFTLHLGKDVPNLPYLLAENS